MITCAILLMEAPGAIDSTTPAGRKKVRRGSEEFAKWLQSDGLHSPSLETCPFVVCVTLLR